ncbi:membrane protein [Halopseudomonas oceani]|uniref:DUF2061 domain-containing protein n=1 Tax=Halopseudomonas oceani TaxID=1708783 RepID=A0A2P4EV19_9GAMM|nr:DUF2061 domain-containing protein [Halopseudomonas oceani]POB03424.1 hypothetical protein C1949_10125 [Halopseudomonas oceani]GGE44265.1 membrane protein [Halopseudomonas oceani]
MTKTITFACMHFSIAFGVVYLLTGSVMVGGAVALIEPAINTVAFYFHEKLWNRLERRRHADQNPMLSPFSA